MFRGAAGGGRIGGCVWTGGVGATKRLRNSKEVQMLFTLKIVCGCTITILLLYNREHKIADLYFFSQKKLVFEKQSTFKML